MVAEIALQQSLLSGSKVAPSVGVGALVSMVYAPAAPYAFYVSMVQC